MGEEITQQMTCGQSDRMKRDEDVNTSTQVITYLHSNTGLVWLESSLMYSGIKN